MDTPSTFPDSRWWDLPAALLLLMVLLTVTTRLVLTGWTDFLSSTQTLAFLGLVLGLALGKSRFKASLSAFLAFAYGLFIVPWQLGLTLKIGLPWLERLGLLWERISFVLFQLRTQQPVTDSIVFLLAMYLLFWSLSVHAAYHLARHGHSWQAVLPAGLTLLVIHSFDPLVSRRTWLLVVYLFLVLALVGRMAYLHRRRQWLESGTALPPHLGLEFVRFTLIAAVAIVVIAWSAPALANALPAAQKAWQPIQRLWDDLSADFQNAFAPLRASVSRVSEAYGPSVVLGRGSELTDTQVFRVDVPTEAPQTLRYYWRARTYDSYDNGHWLSSEVKRYAYNPQKLGFYLPQDYGRWTGNFEFVSVAHISNPFVPAQPLWVSTPGYIEYTENPDGTVDISVFRAVPSLDPTDVYLTKASVSNATIVQLRSAGTDYPEWVSQRYLQLPLSITPRTRQLAETITAGLETPYDKAQAITSYLRSNITYIPILDGRPPDEQEIMDWFLFVYKKGFCNYYATAEVVLLRAAGIPARWAVGYAQGERTPEGDFIVRQRDAHAWPEVYFPNYGWVEFEPTVTQPEVVRLAGEETAGSNRSSDDDENLRRQHPISDIELEQLSEKLEDLNTPTDEPSASLIIAYWTAIVLLLSGLAYLIWRFKARYRSMLPPLPILLEKALHRVGVKPPAVIRQWAHFSSLPSMAKAYLEINRALVRLGQTPSLTDTPAERARKLGDILPSTEDPAQRLVAEYQIDTFSDKTADLIVAFKSAATVKRLSHREAIRRFLNRLRQASKQAIKLR